MIEGGRYMISPVILDRHLNCDPLKNVVGVILVDISSKSRTFSEEFQTSLVVYVLFLGERDGCCERLGLNVNTDFIWIEGSQAGIDDSAIVKYWERIEAEAPRQRH